MAKNVLFSHLVLNKQGSECSLALVWALFGEVLGVLGCLKKRAKLNAGRHTHRSVSWYTMVIFIFCD